MRSFWVKCLVVLLSLTLVSGNAHAALHAGPAHSESCPEEHAHHGTPAPAHPHPSKAADRGCCCDCLGCTSAVSLPTELNSVRLKLSGVVHYAARDDHGTGRALLPEPDPPKAITLI